MGIKKKDSAIKDVEDIKKISVYFLHRLKLRGRCDLEDVVGEVFIIYDRCLKRWDEIKSRKNMAFNTYLYRSIEWHYLSIFDKEKKFRERHGAQLSISSLAEGVDDFEIKDDDKKRERFKKFSENFRRQTSRVFSSLFDTIKSLVRGTAAAMGITSLGGALFFLARGAMSAAQTSPQVAMAMLKLRLQLQKTFITIGRRMAPTIARLTNAFANFVASPAFDRIINMFIKLAKWIAETVVSISKFVQTKDFADNFIRPLEAIFSWLGDVLPKLASLLGLNPNAKKEESSEPKTIGDKMSNIGKSVAKYSLLYGAGAATVGSIVPGIGTVTAGLTGAGAGVIKGLYDGIKEEFIDAKPNNTDNSKKIDVGTVNNYYMDGQRKNQLPSENYNELLNQLSLSRDH